MSHGPSDFLESNPSAKLFVGLTATFVACLILGDVIGGKSVYTPIGPISVGMAAFPVTFLLTDVINDFYGRNGARFVTFVGFGCAALAWVLLQVSTALPVPPDPHDTFITQPEFSKVFGGSARLFVASMVAYMAGQFLDIYVFQFWKTLTQSRHLWLRATGSTLLSQLVDTAAVNGIFWAGRNSVDWVGRKIIREYCIKVILAVLLTPLIYAIHGAIVRRLGITPAPVIAKQK
jgi:queuosine precursor transporter